MTPAYKMDLPPLLFTEYAVSNNAFTLRYLREDDLPRCCELQDLVQAQIPNQDELAFNTPEELRQRLGSKGFTLGAFEGQKLAALQITAFPDPSKNIGKIYGKSTNAAYFQIQLVHPCYRRLGLSNTLNTLTLDIVRRLGIMDLFVTVHPDNLPSIGTLCKAGFYLIDFGHFFSGQVPRYVLWRSLGEMNFRATEPIEIFDQERVRVALNAGYLIGRVAGQDQALYFKGRLT